MNTNKRVLVMRMRYKRDRVRGMQRSKGSMIGGRIQGQLWKYLEDQGCMRKRGRGGGRKVGEGSPGHSVNTEPIGSVLQFHCKFGFLEIGTDRFLKKTRYRENSVSVKSVWFRYLPNNTELITERM